MVYVTQSPVKIKKEGNTCLNVSRGIHKELTPMVASEQNSGFKCDNLFFTACPFVPFKLFAT